MQFLDKVFYMPVIVLRVVSWSRQCSTLFGVSAVAVHHGRRYAVAVPHGPVCSNNHRGSPVRIWCRCPCCWFSTGAVVEKTVEISQFRPGGARPRCAGQQVPQVQSARRQSISHVAASRRICSTLTRWSMSRLCFACLLLFSNRCRDGRWVFFGPCTLVHGQGSPAIRAGKGWRGRWELAPRCSATQLGALRRLAGQTPSCLNYPYHTHHTHHTHITHTTTHTTPTPHHTPTPTPTPHTPHTPHHTTPHHTTTPPHHHTHHTHNTTQHNTNTTQTQHKHHTNTTHHT